MAATQSFTRATLTAVNDLPTGSVTISGTATQGQTLTSRHAERRDGWADQLPVEGDGAKSEHRRQFHLGQAQVGTAITVVASYTDLRPGGKLEQRGDRRGGQRQRRAEGQRHHQRHGY